MSEDHYTHTIVEEAVRRMAAVLNEKQRRRFVGLWAAQYGRGGVRYLNQLTGLSRSTILRGRREALAEEELYTDRVRAPGGGRKRAGKKAAP